MVTSFRPRSPYLPDDSVLTSVRPVSNLSELYTEFASYRLEMLEERIRKQLKILRDNQRAHKTLDAPALKAFLMEQEDFIKRTNEEIVEEEKVAFGYMEETKVPQAADKAPKRIKCEC